MKEIMCKTLIACLIIVLGTVIVMMLNPLRRSEEQIRKNMLKLTPIGTSMVNVIKVIESNEEWEVQYTFEHGYFFMHGRPSRHTPQDDDPVVGEKSMEVHLGEYRVIFVTDVSVFYAFDETSKLIDIAVLKEVDSM